MTDASGSKNMLGKLFVAAGFLLIFYQGLSVWINLHGAMQHYFFHLGGILALAAIISLRDTVDASISRLAGLTRGLLAVTAILTALACITWLYFNIDTLAFTQPFLNTTQLLIGSFLLASVVILTGLLWGLPLALLVVGAVLYFALAHRMPFAWSPPATSIELLVSTLAGYGGPRGAFRFMPLSADMIFMLLVYGGLLTGLGVIKMFSEIGTAIGNKIRGGVAFSALIGSSLIGMVTGQAVSNIALSGSMSIPVMHRSGLSRDKAGAIEIIASTGSQLLPPIMGLGAFLMAEILGVDYFTIIMAGLIPGILYLAATAIGIYALTASAPKLSKSYEPVDWALVRWVLPSLLISLGLIIGVLYARYSPALAGFLGCTSLLIMSMLRPKKYRPKLGSFIDGFSSGLRIATYLALMLAAIGIVVQVLSTTGTGIALGRTIAQLSGESIGIAVLIGMGVSLVIGMGLPTPAAYSLIAIIVAPALIDAGLAPLTAHMFGFYFAIFSALTPPIAVGVLTALRISGGTFGGTVVESFKLGGVCFLIPFLFVAEPQILTPASLSFVDLLPLPSFLAATVITVGIIYGGYGHPLTPTMRLLGVLAGPVAFLFYLGSGNILLALIPIIATIAGVIHHTTVSKSLLAGSRISD